MDVVRWNSKKERSQRYHAFDLDPSGKMQAKTVEQHLYLAYLYLALSREPKYLRLAQKELRSVWKVNGYTENEMVIFGWIFQLVGKGNKSINNNPETAILLLKLGAYLERNLNGMSPIDPKKKQDLLGFKTNEYRDLFKGIFSSYMAATSSKPHLKLPVADEQIILNVIQQSAEIESQLISRDEARSAPFSCLEISPDDAEPPSIDIPSLAKAMCSKQEAVSGFVTVVNSDLRNQFYPWLKCACQGNSEEKKALADRLQLMALAGSSKSDEELMSIKKCLQHILNADHPKFGELLFPEAKTLDAPAAAKLLEQIKGMVENRPEPKDLQIVDIFTEKEVDQGAGKAKEKEISELPQIKPLKQDIFKARKLSPSKVPLKLIKNPSICRNFEKYAEGIQKPEAGFVSPLRYKGKADGWIKDYETELLALKKEPATSAHYKLDLPELKKSLAEAYDKFTRISTEQQKKILTLSNRLPMGELSRLAAINKKMANHEGYIKHFDDMLLFYVNGSPEAWQRMNPHLTPEEAQSLNQEIFDYLQQAILQQSRKRMLRLIGQIEKIHDTESILRKSLEEKLNQEIASAQAFHQFLSSGETTSDRLRLYTSFAYAADITPRKKQISMIENLLNGFEDPDAKEFIAQLIMGGGKSKIILPMLALHIANGERCVLITVPNELIETQKEYMNQISAGLVQPGGKYPGVHSRHPFYKRSNRPYPGHPP